MARHSGRIPTAASGSATRGGLAHFRQEPQKTIEPVAIRFSAGWNSATSLGSCGFLFLAELSVRTARAVRLPSGRRALDHGAGALRLDGRVAARPAPLGDPIASAGWPVLTE